jgi:hypothetical protein
MRRVCRAAAIGCSVAAMRTLRPFVATLGLALALAAAPAAACSPAPDYRMPTNLELAGHAETIVLGRVTGQHQDERGRPTAVVITPLAAIKGELPQGEIALAGMSVAEGERAALSRPYELERPHPDAYSGACIRTVFPLGTTALFFLRTDHEGMWAPAGTAFSRWAEDVPDENAPWVQLARLYTVAAGLPEEDRAPFLEDEREALLARTDEPLAQLMADDIARQLAGPKAPPPDPFEEAFRQPGEESAVEKSLEAMRQGAAEAGN